MGSLELSSGDLGFSWVLVSFKALAIGISENKNWCYTVGHWDMCNTYWFYNVGHRTQLKKRPLALQVAMGITEQNIGCTSLAIGINETKLWFHNGCYRHQ